ncbi:MAG: glycerate kinase [Phycisphaerales bacterium JB063]
MRILIAPDSFKDALPAIDAANAIAEGIRSHTRGHPPTLETLAMSDGGEGFVQAMSHSMPRAARHRVETTDPLGRAITASYLLIPPGDDRPSTAVIELADASGLERLTPHERDPTLTSTFGTGILIRHALDHGARRILLGIGGSATTDAALGIAQALGVPLRDHAGQALARPVTGGDLASVAQSRTDWRTHDPRLRPASTDPPATLRIACDVTNPLHGPRGAAHVYGPQKGASPQQVEQLDRGLRDLAIAWGNAGLPDVADLPGAGAAGGVGGGLVAMFGAELSPGAELVLDAIGFDERLAQADLVITGEGRLDHQSLSGKAAMAVAQRAKAAGVPCVALVGCVGEGAEQALEHGLTSYHVIGEGLPAEESIAQTAKLLATAAAKAIEPYRHT